MKITVDIDCTPAEARAFFGLPDLSAVNAVVTDALKRRVEENIETLSDPVRFWERAMASGTQGFDAMQAAFAQAMQTQDKS
ncbi:MAG: DUF6489 family protein [Parvularcula sp.]|jgi:hypothetical protein|nr:DUF6489 family protein [Parvularcula sp.]